MTQRMFCGLLLCFLAVMMGGCADSEIGNPQKITGLLGKMVDPNGAPLKNAKVIAIPVSFKPGINDLTDLSTTKTLGDGSYAFEYLDYGVYNIQARDSLGRLWLLKTNVSYSDSFADNGTDTLKEPGSLEGEIRINFQPGKNTFCYIPGTSLSRLSDDSGRFVFPQIPAGVFKLGYQYRMATGQGIDSVFEAADSNVSVAVAKRTALPQKLVINFLPKAFAGSDTVVEPGAFVSLHGTGWDSLGRIVQYEWDLDGAQNGSQFIRTPNGDTSLVVSGDVRPYFRVMDNDSNYAVDSIAISVPPKAVTITSIRMFKDTIGPGEVDYGAEVAWSVNQDPDFRYYRVDYKRPTDPGWNTSALYYDRNKTSYKFIGLQASTTYLFQISVFDSTGLFIGSAIMQDSSIAYWGGGALFFASPTGFRALEVASISRQAHDAKNAGCAHHGTPEDKERSFLRISMTRRWELIMG